MADTLPVAMIVWPAWIQRTAPAASRTERRPGPSKRAVPGISSTPLAFSSWRMPPESLPTTSPLRATMRA